jgi:NAD(P)-dependent dehydrogenase (short-subunit alcohol dehydrogenase family)
MFRRARQEFGALDIFVANARPEVPTFYQPPMEVTLKSWQTAIDSQARAFLVGV